MRISAEATSEADPNSNNAGVIIAAIVATAADGTPAFPIVFYPTLGSTLFAKTPADMRYHYLSERPCHYGELRRLLPGLSDKVLTQRLKDLQQSGLIGRGHSTVSNARRPYVLTARGATLTPILNHLYRWGNNHAASFGVHVDNPLQKLDGTDCGT